MVYETAASLENNGAEKKLGGKTKKTGVVTPSLTSSFGAGKNLDDDEGNPERPPDGRWITTRTTIDDIGDDTPAYGKDSGAPYLIGLEPLDQALPDAPPDDQRPGTSQAAMAADQLGYAYLFEEDVFFDARETQPTFRDARETQPKVRFTLPRFEKTKARFKRLPTLIREARFKARNDPLLFLADCDELKLANEHLATLEKEYLGLAIAHSFSQTRENFLKAKNALAQLKAARNALDEGQSLQEAQEHSLWLQIFLNKDKGMRSGRGGLAKSGPMVEYMDEDSGERRGLAAGEYPEVPDRPLVFVRKELDKQIASAEKRFTEMQTKFTEAQLGYIGRDLERMSQTEISKAVEAYSHLFAAKQVRQSYSWNPSMTMEGWMEEQAQWRQANTIIPEPKEADSGGSGRGKGGRNRQEWMSERAEKIAAQKAAAQKAASKTGSGTQAGEGDLAGGADVAAISATGNAPLAGALTRTEDFTATAGSGWPFPGTAATKPKVVIPRPGNSFELERLRGGDGETSSSVDGENEQAIWIPRDDNEGTPADGDVGIWQQARQMLLGNIPDLYALWRLAQNNPVMIARIVTGMFVTAGLSWLAYVVVNRFFGGASKEELIDLSLFTPNPEWDGNSLQDVILEASDIYVDELASMPDDEFADRINATLHAPFLEDGSVLEVLSVMVGQKVSWREVIRQIARNRRPASWEEVTEDAQHAYSESEISESETSLPRGEAVEEEVDHVIKKRAVENSDRNQYVVSDPAMQKRKEASATESYKDKQRDWAQLGFVLAGGLHTPEGISRRKLDESGLGRVNDQAGDGKTIVSIAPVVKTMQIYEFAADTIDSEDGKNKFYYLAPTGQSVTDITSTQVLQARLEAELRDIEAEILKTQHQLTTLSLEARVPPKNKNGQVLLSMTDSEVSEIAVNMTRIVDAPAYADRDWLPEDGKAKQAKLIDDVRKKSNATNFVKPTEKTAWKELELDENIVEASALTQDQQNKLRDYAAQIDILLHQKNVLAIQLLQFSNWVMAHPVQRAGRVPRDVPRSPGENKEAVQQTDTANNNPQPGNSKASDTAKVGTGFQLLGNFVNGFTRTVMDTGFAKSVKIPEGFNTVSVLDAIKEKQFRIWVKTKINDAVGDPTVLSKQPFARFMKAVRIGARWSQMIGRVIAADRVRHDPNASLAQKAQAGLAAFAATAEAVSWTLKVLKDPEVVRWLTTLPSERNPPAPAPGGRDNPALNLEDEEPGPSFNVERRGAGRSIALGPMRNQRKLAQLRQLHEFRASRYANMLPDELPDVEEIQQQLRREMTVLYNEVGTTLPQNFSPYLTTDSAYLLDAGADILGRIGGSIGGPLTILTGIQEIAKDPSDPVQWLKGSFGLSGGTFLTAEHVLGLLGLVVRSVGVAMKAAQNDLIAARAAVEAGTATAEQMEMATQSVLQISRSARLGTDLLKVNEFFTKAGETLENMGGVLRRVTGSADLEPGMEMGAIGAAGEVEVPAEIAAIAAEVTALSTSILEYSAIVAEVSGVVGWVAAIAGIGMAIVDALRATTEQSIAAAQVTQATELLNDSGNLDIAHNVTQVRTKRMAETAFQLHPVQQPRKIITNNPGADYFNRIGGRMNTASGRPFGSSDQWAAAGEFMIMGNTNPVASYPPAEASGNAKNPIVGSDKRSTHVDYAAGYRDNGYKDVGAEGFWRSTMATPSAMSRNAAANAIDAADTVTDLTGVQTSSVGTAYIETEVNPDGRYDLMVIDDLAMKKNDKWAGEEPERPAFPEENYVLPPQPGQRDSGGPRKPVLSPANKVLSSKKEDWRDFGLKWAQYVKDKKAYEKATASDRAAGPAYVRGNPFRRDISTPGDHPMQIVLETILNPVDLRLRGNIDRVALHRAPDANVTITADIAASEGATIAPQVDIVDTFGDLESQVPIAKPKKMDITVHLTDENKEYVTMEYVFPMVGRSDAAIVLKAQTPALLISHDSPFHIVDLLTKMSRVLANWDSSVSGDITETNLLNAYKKQEDPQIDKYPASKIVVLDMVEKFVKAGKVIMNIKDDMNRQIDSMQAELVKRINDFTA